MTKTLTHELYIARLAKRVAKSRELAAEDRKTLARVRLAYGDGLDGVMGITRFDRWQHKDGKAGHWCAVCATCQPEGAFLLAETVVHELGHAIAGRAAAHGPDWKAACVRLGLVDAKATYAHGDKPVWAPWLKAYLDKTPEPSDGRPVYGTKLGSGPDAVIVPPTIRPCSAGVGSQGGKSSGVGSKSRYLLYTCGCTKLRHAGQELKAKCLQKTCGKRFRLVESSLPPTQAE